MCSLQEYHHHRPPSQPLGANLGHPSLSTAPSSPHIQEILQVHLWVTACPLPATPPHSRSDPHCPTRRGRQLPGLFHRLQISLKSRLSSDNHLIQNLLLFSTADVFNRSKCSSQAFAVSRSRVSVSTGQAKVLDTTSLSLGPWLVPRRPQPDA